MSIADNRALLDEISEKARLLRRMAALTNSPRSEDIISHLSEVIAIADAEFERMGDEEDIANARAMVTEIPAAIPYYEEALA